MKTYITHVSRLSLLILTIFLLLGLPISTQRHSARIRVNTSRLMEIKNVGVIYISPAMFQSALKASLRIDGAESTVGIMDGTTSIHIYTVSDRKAVQEIRCTLVPIIELRRSDLEQLMYVKDDDRVANLVGQIQGDNASEPYMFVSGDDEYTVINLSGSFPRRQLEKAAT